MNQKKQLIILGVLFVILIIAGAVVFLRPKDGDTAGRPANSNDTAATGSADAAATQVHLPSMEELDELKNWLLKNKAEELVAACPDKGVFGLEAYLPEEDKVANTGPALASGKVFETAPIPLDGIICRVEASVAIFDGEPYGIGDKIAGSEYLVAKIDRTSVTVVSDNRERREVVLSMLEL